jgi:hypothetical protein
MQAVAEQESQFAEGKVRVVIQEMLHPPVWHELIVGPNLV